MKKLILAVGLLITMGFISQEVRADYYAVWQSSSVGTEALSSKQLLTGRGILHSIVITSAPATQGGAITPSGAASYLKIGNSAGTGNIVCATNTLVYVHASTDTQTLNYDIPYSSGLMIVAVGTAGINGRFTIQYSSAYFPIPSDKVWSSSVVYNTESNRNVFTGKGIFHGIVVSSVSDEHNYLDIADSSGSATSNNIGTSNRVTRIYLEKLGTYIYDVGISSGLRYSFPTSGGVCNILYKKGISNNVKVWKSSNTLGEGIDVSKLSDSKTILNKIILESAGTDGDVAFGMRASTASVVFTSTIAVIAANGAKGQYERSEYIFDTFVSSGISYRSSAGTLNMTILYDKLR